MVVNQTWNGHNQNCFLTLVWEILWTVQVVSNARFLSSGVEGDSPTIYGFPSMRAGYLQLTWVFFHTFHFPFWSFHPRISQQMSFVWWFKYPLNSNLLPNIHLNPIIALSLFLSSGLSLWSVASAPQFLSSKDSPEMHSLCVTMFLSYRQAPHLSTHVLFTPLCLMCDGSLRQVLTHFQVFLSLDPGLGLIFGLIETGTANKKASFMMWDTLRSAASEPHQMMAALSSGRIEHLSSHQPGMDRKHWHGTNVAALIN